MGGNKNKCCISQCPNSNSKEPNSRLSFFQFPNHKTDPERLQAWLSALKLPNASKCTVICEDHFKQNQFTSSNRSRLKKGAVPCRVVKKSALDKQNVIPANMVQGSRGVAPKIIMPNIHLPNYVLDSLKQCFGQSLVSLQPSKSVSMNLVNQVNAPIPICAQSQNEGRGQSYAEIKVEPEEEEMIIHPHVSPATEDFESDPLSVDSSSMARPLDLESSELVESSSLVAPHRPFNSIQMTIPSSNASAILSRNGQTLIRINRVSPLRPTSVNHVNRPVLRPKVYGFPGGMGSDARPVSFSSISLQRIQSNAPTPSSSVSPAFRLFCPKARPNQVQEANVHVVSQAILQPARQADDNIARLYYKDEQIAKLKTKYKQLQARLHAKVSEVGKLKKKLLKAQENPAIEPVFQNIFGSVPPFKQFLMFQAKVYSREKKPHYSYEEKFWALTLYYSCREQGYTTLINIGFKLPCLASVRRWIGKSKLNLEKRRRILKKVEPS